MSPHSPPHPFFEVSPHPKTFSLRGGGKCPAGDTLFGGADDNTRFPNTRKFHSNIFESSSLEYRGVCSGMLAWHGRGV